MSFLQKIITKLEQRKNKNLGILHIPNKNINEDEAKKIIIEGNKFEDSGDFDNAIDLYEKSIFIAPDYIGGYINKGNVLLSMDRPDDAIHSYLKALNIDENSHSAYYNLGTAYQKNNQFQLALSSFEKSISLKPDFFDAWIAHGNLLSDLKKYDLAIASYQKALTLNQNFGPVYRNLGLAFHGAGKLTEAKDSFLVSNQLYPSLDNYCDIGNIYRQMGDIRRAIEITKEGCKFDPTSPGPHSLLLFCIGHDPSVTQEVFFQEHLGFGRKFDVDVQSRKKLENDKSINRILNIGIVSPDLYSHAVASFFEPIFNYLIKSPSINLYIYDNMGIDDQVSRRMKAICHNWTVISSMDNLKFEQLIRSDKIDILIDLSGHTPANRLLVFAKKPAPIQMSWIGYPATTGMSSIDYYIGDRHFLPPGEFDHIFTEKILRLPATTPFKPDTNAPEVNELPAIKNGYITFGSFNRLDKINISVVELWSKLLNRIPSSKMLIGGMPVENDLSQLKKWFNDFNVDIDRIKFYQRGTMYDYLLMHHQVDVCLDTFPYGGSTTTSHAVVMGVPTLTVIGQFPISNAGRSILSQLNLSDIFVAIDHDDFINKGIWCSENISYLVKLRSNLRDNLKSSNLMNNQLIADTLGFAFKYTWERWCNNLPPVSFEVIKSNDTFQIINQ